MPEQKSAATKLCAVSIFSSRVCEKGTKGCTIVHGAPTAASSPQEFLLALARTLPEIGRRVEENYPATAMQLRVLGEQAAKKAELGTHVPKKHERTEPTAATNRGGV